MRFDQNVLRATWKKRLVQFSWKAHCFPVLARIWCKSDDIVNLDVQKCDLAKMSCARPEKSVLYNFQWKRTAFSFWREFEASVTICRSLTPENAIVLRTTWKERFAQFLWKPHCLPVLARIWGKSDDIVNLDVQKCDLAKVCCAWLEKSVLCNFYGKRNVFPFWREFEARVTILRTWTFKNTIWSKPEKSVLHNFYGNRTIYPFWREFEARVTILWTWTFKNAIWPKYAAHDLKRAFCTIFMETALFSRFGENLRPVWRFGEVWRSIMRFGLNVLRTT